MVVERIKRIWNEERDKYALGALLTWIFISVIIIPLLSLYAGRGAEEQAYTSLYFLYVGTALGAFFFLKQYKELQNNRLKYKSNKRINKFGGRYSAFIWDFENSFLYDLSEKKGFGWLKGASKFSNQLIFGIVAFSFLGLAGIISDKIKNTFFIGIAPVFNQVTETAQISLNVYPASPSETLVDVAVISLVHGWIYDKLMIKRNTPKALFWIIDIIAISTIVTVFRVLLHLGVYRGQDLNLLAVGIFSVITVLVTLATGSILLALIYHDANNFFLALQKLFSGTDILVYSIIIIFTIIIFIFALGIIRKALNKEDLGYYGFRKT